MDDFVKQSFYRIFYSAIVLKKNVTYPIFTLLLFKFGEKVEKFYFAL